MVKAVVVKAVMTTFRNTHAGAVESDIIAVGYADELWISATRCLLPGLLTSCLLSRLLCN